ncbi:MAG: ATP-binding protein [Phycisphaerae bacterium]|nr:ATP-binding protein [Phycisphaerae bacterium]
MPSVGRFLDVLEAFSRHDRQGVVDVVRAVAEEERRRNHFGAAHQLLQALDVVVQDDRSDVIPVLSRATGSAPPIDTLERVVSPKKTSPVVDARLQRNIREFIAEWSSEARLRDAGLSPRSTVLLYGPPGCGKTHLAEYLACSLGLPMYVVRFDALVSSYLGETASNVRKVFEFISTNRCLVLLDEIDAIGKQRDDKNDLGELKRVVISLLQNLDLQSGQSPLVAATNHPHLLDPALWRRFEVVWELRLPDRSQRAELIDAAIGASNVIPARAQIVEATEGLSGADFAKATVNAKRRALINSDSIETSFILSLIENLRGHHRTPTEDERSHAIADLALLLREIAAADSYSYKELESISGIAHSTLHHRSRSRQQNSR